MSSSNSASVYQTYATSSSDVATSSDDSTIGSTNIGTFKSVDHLTVSFSRCCDKIEKYYQRRNNLVSRIKSLRASSQAKLIPPPNVPQFEVEKEPLCFERKLTDSRLYSEVAELPASSSSEEEIFNVPIVRTNLYLINNLQKQININEWRLNKQINKRKRLDQLMKNQVAYSPVFNPNPVYNPTTEPISEQEYRPFPALPTSTKTKKCRKSRSSIHDSIFGVYVPKYTATRDVNLAFKLRLKIRSFRYTITNHYINYLLYYKFKILTYPIYPQMDAHGEEGSVSADKKLNTVIATQRDDSQGVSTPIIYPEWQELVTSDHFSSYNTSTNRWLKYKTLAWSNNKITPVDKINVPSDLLTELVNTPLFIPFRNNRYWKGDFEFKFVLNSNKFQQGSLQISFMYCSDLEQSFNTYRNNIYCGSQTNHCILNAGSSNEGTLIIPFKYFNPVITTNPKENVDYCKIFIRTLNPLVCSSTTFNSADLTIFINLNNAYFTGSIDFTLIQQPQMFHLMRALIKTTEFGLNQIDPDSNRDNPPDISTPTNITITNASSWCTGTNSIEPVNHLRLDTLGQTPHPNLQHDELKTSVITRIFGLIHTVEWKFSHAAGDHLLTIEAAPMSNLLTYPSQVVTLKNKTYTLYNLPPVAVISNLFAYWRGTLEIRIDFVATSFHTGSLLIAYIPGIKNTVTIDQARSSNYVICSLQEQQTYTIRVPYIANSPSWPRKYNKSYKIHNSSEINPPGSIQFFVLNPLIPLDNVYSSININYYIRGGTDFEVLVPIQPNISTPYNLDYKDNKFNEMPLTSASGTSTVFNYLISSPTGLSNSYVTLVYAPTDRLTPISYEELRDGQIISKNNRYTDLFDLIPDQPGILPFYLESSMPITFSITTPDKQNVFYSCSTFVLYNELCHNEGHTILWPVISREAAQKYARSDQSWSQLVPALIPALKCYKNSDTVNITFLTKIFVHVHNVDHLLDDYCFPQNEERLNSTNFLDMTQSLPTTGYGLQLYGESFNDLKNYCRRYQYYTNISYKNDNPLIKKQALAIIPLVPQGLVNSLIYNDNTVNHIVNRCKDGFIPIISSGYRFYRGGLRLRIVSDTRRNINLWVQHRPEMLLKFLQTHIIDPDNQSLSDYFNHSYSFTIQNLELNNVLSIEIPWYSKNMLGCSFLPKVQSSSSDINAQKQTAFSLGSLVLGIDASPLELKTPINFEIFYSLADDFHFNTFQGFPLMLTLDQIPSTYQAQPQMGWIDNVVNNHPTIKKFDDLAEKIGTKIDSVSDILGRIPEIVNGFYFDSDTTVRLILSNLLFEIMHLLVSPTLKTVAVTVLSICTRLGLVVGEGVLQFYRLIKKLFKLIGWGKKKTEETNITDPQPSTSKQDLKPKTKIDAGVKIEAVPQADTGEESETCAGIVAIIWAGLNSMLNVSFKTCDTLGDCGKVLLDGITKGAMQANTIFRFIKNCFSVIEKCYKALIHKIYSKYHRYQRLQVEQESLQEWLNLCDCLLSPSNNSLVQNDLKWREAVYSAARYGHLYLCQQKPGVAPRVDVYIRKIYDKIINLRDSLQAEKLFPSLRMEAYGLWIDGPPGIGKSSMITRLSTDLLNSVNYKGSSNLIFNVTPLDKYWNNCNHQPVISIDDAFAITTPECIQNQLWTYFTVMSPVPLIPPMAEIKDKKMHYNPEIMITCSNNAFPRVAGLAESTALYRRRHQLIKAQLKDPSKQVYPYGCTDAQLNEFEHLQFALSSDPRCETAPYGKLMNYKELIEVLKKDFIFFKRRSAFAYEERKRLQFSMTTTSEARSLPETKNISAYLKEIDTEKFKKLATSNTTNENEPLAETYKLIDLVQKHPDFKLAFKVEIPEKFKALITNDNVDAPIPVETIEQISEQIQSTSEILPDPQMDDNQVPERIPEDFDWNGQITNTPEESAQAVEVGKQYEEMLQQRAKFIQETNIPGFEDLNAQIAAHFDNKGLEGLQYRIKFSKFAVILSMANKSNPIRIFDNPLVNGLAYFNKTNNCTYNTYKHISRTQCLHELLPECRLVEKRTINNITFPVWKIQVAYDNDKCCLKYSPWSNEFVELVDTPCMYADCIITRTRQWTELMSSWLPWGLKYAPWIIKEDYSPIVTYAAQQLSKTRKFINSIHYWVNKTVKFCLYDVLYKSACAFGKMFATIGVFLTGFAGLVGLTTTCMRAFSKPNPQLISSGDTGTKSPAQTVRKLVFNSFNPQSTDEQNQIRNVIGQRIIKNTIFIRYENKKTGRVSNMKCLVIKERFALVLRHYIEYLETNCDTDSEVSLLWADCGHHPFNFKDYKIDWCKDSNLGIIRLPNWFAAKRSLLPFISQDTNFYGSIVRDCTIIDHNVVETYIYDQDIGIAEDVVIAPTSYSKSLIMKNAYSYKKNYAGMCGSVLLSNKPLRPIIGIHVAGANNKGFSEPICASLFENYFNVIEGKLVDDIVPIDWRTLECKQVPVEERKLYLTGTHNYLGTVDKNIAKYEMGISSIVPSTIQGVFPVGTQPGPLTPKDPRIQNAFSPLLEGCNKHCNPTIDFNKTDLSTAEKDLLGVILTNCKPIRLTVRPLDELQAINGIPGLEDYRPLVWNTSEGFYLSRLRPAGARDKRWLFNFNEDGIATAVHPNLREILDSKHCDRLNNIVPLTIHDDCLKDARLPLHKIKVPGKVRVFSISPVDFTIQFRQYYLDFIASYTQARFKAEHAIGINVHGLEWSELGNMFKNKHIITGDYSGFGPTLNSEVVAAAFRIINKWYTAYGGSVEDNQIRIIMSKELINAKHLMGDYLYEVNCGLPSGNPATVIFNSLVNSLYLRCAWLDIMRGTINQSLVDQRRLMKIITYGDDLIASIDPTVVDRFNNNSLSFFFKKHNITFTDAAKTGINVEPYIGLDTATFLKHSFNPHPKRKGLYLAQLEELSITECANWIRKSPDLKQATLDNCVQGSMLAYGHGPDYYNNYVEIISKAWFKEYQEEFLVRTWDELDSLFLDQGYHLDW
uniref:Genome polyprotein n=1 Tax=Watermelon iflavirus 1 TaxID=3237972 RepID=A0AB39AH70_9VIRU